MKRNKKGPKPNFALQKKLESYFAKYLEDTSRYVIVVLAIRQTKASGGHSEVARQDRSTQNLILSE